MKQFISATIILTTALMFSQPAQAGDREFWAGVALGFMADRMVSTSFSEAVYVDAEYIPAYGGDRHFYYIDGIEEPGYAEEEHVHDALVWPYGSAEDFRATRLAVEDQARMNQMLAGFDSLAFGNEIHAWPTSCGSTSPGRTLLDARVAAGPLSATQFTVKYFGCP